MANIQIQKTGTEIHYCCFQTMPASDLERWKDAGIRIRMALGLNMCDLLQVLSLSWWAKRGYGEKYVGEPLCRQPSSEKANFGFSSSLAKKAVGTSMSAIRMVRRSSG